MQLTLSIHLTGMRVTLANETEGKNVLILMRHTGIQRHQSKYQEND